MTNIKNDVLPFKQDPSSRLLPWMIGFMVWLAALTLVVALMLSNSTGNWKRNFQGSLTVQILPETVEDSEILKAKIERALQILSTIPSIQSSVALTTEKIDELLEPWLGKGMSMRNLALPIPTMIDIHLKRGASVDKIALQKKLKEEIPGAILDDHGAWLDRLHSFTKLAQIITLVILILICTASILMIIFATRTSFLIHEEVIELMHLLGAHDNYISKQFSNHAFWLGTQGGVSGIIFSLATYFLLQELSLKTSSLSIISFFSLDLSQWAIVLSTGLIAILISTCTARITVHLILKRMI